jgi:elongation factor 3
MRAISSGALAGFPGAEELMKLRACFVDHDIDGSDANVPTIDFCLQEPVLAPLGREKIRQKLLEMEFTEELIAKPICNLSGGWKMKLALARAVLLDADLLLLDEPTNHLDVQKQQWLCDFLTGPACEHVTTLVVSHDSKFLNKVLTDVTPGAARLDARRETTPRRRSSTTRTCASSATRATSTSSSSSAPWPRPTSPSTTRR